MHAAPVAPVTPDLPAAQSLAPEAAPQRRARTRVAAVALSLGVILVRRVCGEEQGWQRGGG